MANVAFIGLGRMGHGMAGRYLDGGFAVAVWNRSRAKAGDLVARGARWAASPAEAADGADAIVTMVADDEASRAVWLGKDGAAQAAKPGALAIECSTVSYRSSGAICERAALFISTVPSPACPTPRRPES
jgi:3-hydroxyisobutyrate dehydrogenase-like beta-hydroxyacid dehydrogenase